MAIEAGSSTYYQAKRGIVQDGLVLHLDAGVKESYSGGNIWRDLSGNGNHATLTNGPSYTKRNGGMISLDGTNDWIATSFNPNVNNNRLVTMEIWFRDDNPGISSSTNTALISNYGPSGTIPLLIMHINSNGQAYIQERNSSATLSGAPNSVSSISTGEWKQVVGTFASSSLVMRVNGSVTGNHGSRVGETVTSGQNWVIGGNHLGRYQSCDIAIVRVYLDNAFGTDQAQQNFNATRHRFGL